jgi:hypothetical protein
LSWELGSVPIVGFATRCNLFIYSLPKKTIIILQSPHRSPPTSRGCNATITLCWYPGSQAINVYMNPVIIRSKFKFPCDIGEFTANNYGIHVNIDCLRPRVPTECDSSVIKRLHLVANPTIGTDPSSQDNHMYLLSYQGPGSGSSSIATHLARCTNRV